jgi:hypothetical protein
MSRRSFIVAIGIVALLAGGGSAAAVLLLSYEPGHYARAAVTPGKQREKLSKDFQSEFSELLNGSGGRFTEEQINSFLEEAFMRSGLGEKLLPDGVSEPRVVLEPERLRIAFRYRSSLLNTIVSISLRVWLPRAESNVVAVQIEGFRAGAMPFTAQWLLEHISETARQNGIEVNWYRHEGRPVALLRFQADSARPTLQLKAVQLEQGSITIQGRFAENAALPFLPRELVRR